jgi:hypothetical protein
MGSIPKKRIAWATLLFAAFLSPSSIAQVKVGQRALPTMETPQEPVKPGTWAQYSMLNLKSEQGILVRLAALDFEGKGQWLEIKFTDSRRRSLVIRSLVEGGLHAPKKILKTIVQPQNQKPLFLPERMASQPLPILRSGPDPSSKLVARVKVKVPAGSFVADRYTTGEGSTVREAWFSTEKLGWPLLKARTPDLLLELVSQGTGARTEIRGKPAPLDPKLLEQMLK